MKTTVAAAALALALAAPAGHAQEAAAGPERGQYSISLSTQGDLEVGLWTRLSPRTDLGLNLTLNQQQLEADEVEQSARTIRVEPALKRYLGARDGFAPYALGSVFALLSEDEDEVPGVGAITYEERAFGGSAAVGIDRFPARRVSLGGHLGLSAGVRDLSVSDPSEGEDRDADGWFVSTFNSGVVVHLYF